MQTEYRDEEKRRKKRKRKTMKHREIQKTGKPNFWLTKEVTSQKIEDEKNITEKQYK